MSHGLATVARSHADVAELVDARRSGRRELTLVEVRVLSSAWIPTAPIRGRRWLTARRAGRARGFATVIGAGHRRRQLLRRRLDVDDVVAQLPRAAAGRGH